MKSLERITATPIWRELSEELRRRYWVGRSGNDPEFLEYKRNCWPCVISSDKENIITSIVRRRSLVDIVASHKPSKQPRVYPYYRHVYPKYFDSIRCQKLKILEIGVAMGGSLKTFQEYFENSLIYGIDISEKCKFSYPRIEIFIGDQADTSFLQDVVNKAGPFDIVIDDGSHQWEDQVTSLNVLLPHTKRLYSIEDLQKDKYRLVPYLPQYLSQVEAVHLHPKCAIFEKR